MRRSKYGYLLLALLVITGLAGTVTSTSITAKDRKFAANNLRETKSEVLKSLQGLSRAQLNFKPSPGTPSIKQRLYRIATAEKNMWQLLEESMKQPANPEQHTQVTMTDEQLMQMVENGTRSCSAESFESKCRSYKNVDEALENFTTARAVHIKYMKNTTEDLRNHLVKMSFGWIDCYQLCLLMSAQSDRLMQEIEDTKTDPNFPSR